MTLVSPGVETSIIDESLFVSNASSLVPLFFIATQDEKIRSNGEAAPYTFEHSVVRSITSLRQSISSYGEPTFLTDGSGNQLHGDARNEYGLMAMNQYLGIGNGAYAVRANVNLNDSLDDIQDQWDTKSDDASVVIQNMIQNYINNVNLANGITTDGASVLKDVSSKIPASQTQTEQEFTGGLPYGSGIFDTAGDGVASNFAVGDVVTFNSGMQIQITGVDLHAGATPGAGVPSTFVVSTQGTRDGFIGTALVVTAVIDAALQDAMLGSPTIHPSNVGSERSGFTVTPQLANFETFLQTDVDFSGFVGGLNYAPNDVITLSNSAQVKVVTVDGSGAVLTFALVSQGTTVTVGSTLTGFAVSPANTVTPQTGFSLPVIAANLQTKKLVVSGEELKTIVSDATNFIFDEDEGVYAFRTLRDDFFNEKTASGVVTLPTAFDIFTNGFDFAASGDKFIGFDGEVAVGVANATTTNAVADEWTPAEGADLFGEVATSFKFTIPFLTKSSLGANDAARRVSIVSALQSAIVSNTDVRSENFQFNVIACPGYPEVVDELLALSADQKGEALVVGDTPSNLSPESLTNPTNGWAASTARQNSTDVCYYYPWCLASNLDGSNVLAAPSGIAIRQMAYNDNISYLWYAPAGVTRGLVSGVTDVGYAVGVLGTATTFKGVALNQGQRDALYQDTPSGRLNPIVFQPGKGIALMGQKTSSPKTSALDRINVVRLVMHVRRQLRLTTVNFLFEPNDQRTRDNVKAVADNFLGTIMVNRGIVDFLTVCDESNNTADVVDRSELILDVLIKPTKAVEFISIPIRIVSQGADI